MHARIMHACACVCTCVHGSHPRVTESHARTGGRRYTLTGCVIPPAQRNGQTESVNQFLYESANTTPNTENLCDRETGTLWGVPSHVHTDFLATPPKQKPASKTFSPKSVRPRLGALEARPPRSHRFEPTKPTNRPGQSQRQSQKRWPKTKISHFNAFLSPKGEYPYPESEKMRSAILSTDSKPCPYPVGYPIPPNTQKQKNPTFRLTFPQQCRIFHPLRTCPKRPAISRNRGHPKTHKP